MDAVPAGTSLLSVCLADTRLLRECLLRGSLVR